MTNVRLIESFTITGIAFSIILLLLVSTVITIIVIIFLARALIKKKENVAVHEGTVIYEQIDLRNNHKSNDSNIHTDSNVAYGGISNIKAI